MFRWAVGILAVVSAVAQSPYTAAPDQYKLEMQNRYVRISRVTYHKGDRTAEHVHPATPTVYIYLTDSGPLRFSHTSPNFSAERPALKAGTVRFNRNAQVEKHETEYLGDCDSAYLRVELKTQPDRPHPDARLRSPEAFPWEDAQVRISRVQGAIPKLTRRSLVVLGSTGKWVWVDPEKGSVPPLQDPEWAVILELKSET
jgi:hypothetical protein